MISNEMNPKALTLKIYLKTKTININLKRTIMKSFIITLLFWLAISSYSQDKQTKQDRRPYESRRLRCRN
jgi:hypothetical protein